MTDMWQEYSQSLRSPRLASLPPDLTPPVSHQMYNAPASLLSLPDASATVPLTHYNQSQKPLLGITLVLLNIVTGDCRRLETASERSFLWRRYNRHCPEIYTQHVTSSPLQIKTHFLCESSLLSDFFSFNRSWSVMTCCPQLPTRKVLRFSTESPGLPAATWQRTDGKWQEILIKRWTWSCQVIITIILTHLLKYPLYRATI